VAGVIQNFEIVDELGFKMLRRQIEAEAASPDVVDWACTSSAFRDIIQQSKVVVQSKLTNG
jgi:hypothetical protein